MLKLWNIDIDKHKELTIKYGSIRISLGVAKLLGCDGSEGEGGM